MSVVVTINSVDKTSSVVFNSLDKTDNLNQQVDSLNFSIRKYATSTYVPLIGQEVIVTANGTRVFGGVIVRIDESIDKNPKVLYYNIQCTDFAQYLKRHLVTERYENMTLAAIVNDLRANYATDFTSTGTVTGPTIESIAFNRITVAEALQKLSEAVGYVWYVDYYKDIHIFPKNTEMAPFNITDTSGNYIFESLSITEDITQVRNSVLVQGGEEESAGTRTETFTGDNTKTQFALANKFSSLPVVTVSSVAKTVGVEFLDDDASFQCMWNFNEKYIRFTSGNTPGAAAPITVTQKYLFPIVVSVPSPMSIASFGTYEFAITDKSISSQQEAIDRAVAELTSYQNQLYNGEFRTYVDGLRSGQVININSVQRGRNVDVLIQSVNMTMRDPLGTMFEYKVRFATLKDIGIIEYLQRQLRDREIIVDDTETLLTLYQFSDTVAASDSIATPTYTTGPYTYGPHASQGRYGYSTYS